MQSIVEVGATPPASAIIEQLRLRNIHLVTISGNSGTLKSSIGNVIRDATGIPLIGIGEAVRERLRKVTGEELIGPLPSAFRSDAANDAEQLALMETALRDRHPLLLESRLGGYLAKEHFAQEYRPHILSILVASLHTKKRMHRVHMRYEQQMPDLTLERTTALTHARAEDDHRNWKAIYPTLLDYASPFDEQLETTSGDQVYDLVLHIDGTRDAYKISSGITKLNGAISILEFLRFKDSSSKDDLPTIALS